MEILRPGGRLLISDYCRKAGPVSAGFEKYIKQRGYDLHRHASVCTLRCAVCQWNGVRLAEFEWQKPEALLKLSYEHRLCSVDDYGEMLKGAGFTDVVAEDRTWQVLRTAITSTD